MATIRIRRHESRFAQATRATRFNSALTDDERRAIIEYLKTR
jgi:hypothetical protein